MKAATYHIHRILYEAEFQSKTPICVAAVLMKNGRATNVGIRNTDEFKSTLPREALKFLEGLARDLKAAEDDGTLGELTQDALNSWSNTLQITDAEPLEALDGPDALLELSRAVS